jgi:hypothetical protein
LEYSSPLRVITASWGDLTLGSPVN